MPPASKPHVVAIVQARMNATRLPGKPLKKILQRPLLSYELERLRRAKTIDEIVVATTTSPQDDQIVELCHHERIPIFRGSEENVLERYLKAAKEHRAEVVVRITGDCPLIDPEVVDRVINFYFENEYDYVSNTRKLTYPRGLDVEVFPVNLLERIAGQATRQPEREHVTLYFYEHPELFKLGNVACETDESKHRWTVDTEEDFQLISRIIESLYPKNPQFGMRDVLKLLQQHPDWVALNAHIKQKGV